jgi:hypothetical protein
MLPQLLRAQVWAMCTGGNICRDPMEQHDYPPSLSVDFTITGDEAVESRDDGSA